MALKFKRRTKQTPWSAKKNWWMGILDSLIVAAVLAIAAYVWDWTKPAPLSDQERTAVYSLIDDIKAHPLHLSMVYLNEHPFIDNHWLKSKPDAPFFESSETTVNLFQLGYAVGIYGDALQFLDPMVGTVTARITDVDEYTLHKRENMVIRAEPREADPSQQATLDLNRVRLYSTSPRLISPAILAHLDKLDIPSEIREALRSLAVAGLPMSVRKIAAGGADFLIVADNSRLRQGSDFHQLDEHLGLYAYGSQISAYQFVRLAATLAESIQGWADEHHIDLGKESKTFFENIYR